MSEEIIKKYEKDGLTVIWKPQQCIHSGVCVRTLPKVYNPKERPWMKLENASVEELKSQIDKCPSGALSYEINNSTNGTNEATVTIDIVKNGPALIKGMHSINNDTKSQTAICRCGGSSNKPFCDGSHQKNGFEG